LPDGVFGGRFHGSVLTGTCRGLADLALGSNAAVQIIPASHGGGGIESLFEAPGASNEPEFPFILDRNRKKSWDFEMSLDGLRGHEFITRMRPAVDFISRKQRHVVYGAWQKPKLP
jgi:hypothetical protein